MKFELKRGGPFDSAQGHSTRTEENGFLWLAMSEAPQSRVEWWTILDSNQ